MNPPNLKLQTLLAAANPAELPPPVDPVLFAGYALLALIGLGGSALCSGSETGLYTLNHARLTLRAHQPDADKRTKRLLEDVERPDRPLAALLVGNNLFNYFGVLGLTACLAMLGFSETALVLINTLILTPILLVFAESLPKEIMRQRADELVPRIAPFLFFLERASAVVGVLPALLFVARAAARLTGGASAVSLAERQRRRVGALLKEGAPLGLITERQAALVDNALRFHAATVRDVMHHWPDVVTLPEHATPAQAARTLADARCLRAPLVNDQGRLLGLIDAADLHAAARSPNPPPLPDIARPAVRIAPDHTVREALHALRAKGARAAIVLDNNKPVGFVSIRDLIQPLTGPIAEW